MIKAFVLRVLRFVGVLALIYVSMVFYFALTERQNAFPRAITHKEANEAIADRAKGISCTLEDGLVLQGWKYGNEDAPVMLYYPDADEDAAQFLAEIDSFPEIQIVTFNYRGSGENKGKPSQETFETDADQIAQCAVQVNGGLSFVAGRGTGAILATRQATCKPTAPKRFLLIDPVKSIAEAVSQKYRAFYPEFLVRANVQMDSSKIGCSHQNTVVVIDRKQFEARSKVTAEMIPGVTILRREGGSLQKTIKTALHFSPNL